MPGGTTAAYVTAPLLLAAGILDLFVAKALSSLLSSLLARSFREPLIWESVVLFVLVLVVYLLVCEVLLSGRSLGRACLSLRMARRSGSSYGLFARLTRFARKVMTLGYSGMTLTASAGYDRHAGIVWIADIGVAGDAPQHRAPPPVRPKKPSGNVRPIRGWRFQAIGGVDDGKGVIVGKTRGFHSSRVVKIGRDSAWADLVLDSPKVSAQHCVIRFNGDAAEILDYGSNGAGSTNGTTIHGKGLRPREWRLIGGATHFFAADVKISISR